MNVTKFRDPRSHRVMWALLLGISLASCTGGRGADGQNGTDCTVQQASGAAVVSCDDGTEATVNPGDEGPAGADGTDGADGADGENGATGTDGADGTNGLVSLLDEPLGVNCPLGGTVILAGQDLDDNGTLDTTEVTSKKYICNGVNGSTGKTSLAVTQQENPGTHCIDGGIAISTGLDNNSNGQLEPTEVTQTQYLCQTLCKVVQRNQSVPAIENVDVDYVSGLVVTNNEVLAQIDATHDTVGWVGFDLTNLPSNSVVLGARLFVRHNATSNNNVGTPSLQVLSGSVNHIATSTVSSTSLPKGTPLSAPTSLGVSDGWNSVTLTLDSTQLETDRSDGFLTLGLANVSVASSAASLFGSQSASTRPYLEFTIVTCE